MDVDLLYIEKSVAEIKEIAKHDDEAAHSLEDALYDLVLEAIAGGAENPKELAAASLQIKEINFFRYRS